jgi:hypothetical protein
MKGNYHSFDFGLMEKNYVTKSNVKSLRKIVIKSRIVR